jgi:hypothetical protein
VGDFIVVLGENLGDIMADALFIIDNDNFGWWVFSKNSTAFF